MNYKKPRGIRNNNPLNIRIGNRWVGEVNLPTDREFEQFLSMKFGCRAGFIILRNYINRHLLKTIPQIISRWAPKNENATLNYIKSVCEQTGFDEVHRFEFDNKEEMIALFKAMVFVENGYPIDESDIRDGYDMAVSQSEKYIRI